MDFLNIVLTALNQLIAQLVNVLPKLIIAMLIWYLGKYIITLGVALVRKVDLKHTTIDSKAIETLALAVSMVGRVVLVLVILDYLGIGRSIVAAIAQGVTFAIAIALGLAFGKALEPDATDVVKSLRKFFRK